MSDFRQILTSAPPLSAVTCNNWSAPVPPWLCSLSDFGLIRASGKDAFEFLNKQLSNDLKDVSEDTSQFSAYCSPKGRLYCTFHIFMRDGDYLLRTTSTTLASTLNRLRLFVLNADVALDEEKLLCGIALIGPHGAYLLNEVGLPAPAEVFNISRKEQYTVIRSPGVCERYEIYAPHRELAAAWTSLSPLTNPSTGVWRLYDIFSGIPNIYPQTSELFVPQMVNLDLTDALSFSKGCYPGQEVVARTHYLGKLKRRMYRLSSSSSEPAPGDAVFVSDYSTEQPSGEIVDACKLPDGKSECLAALRIRGLEGGGIHLGGPDGGSASIKPLPYKITAETWANQTQTGNKP